ncbi:hypothetical protein ZYGR_0I02440 [Zygosaccharomyces rouxii]|uniref:ZYRO0C05786p n=2 Tax=Zygosaccharomyces rouxii TaxID=4956 RepID=C5DT63_ZYGRC|nr:uncharacterized protein ZYRO0C05786g [Zygosaccharomyces rouxii]GAV47948.1 hypothetical protein ZYGR_0I02440 [Zygosaccharomyces rouxii]CAR26974.1 ZYRO0C05786p [Zygosaccharomyces rouxii]
MHVQLSAYDHLTHPHRLRYPAGSPRSMSTESISSPHSTKLTLISQHPTRYRRHVTAVPPTTTPSSHSVHSSQCSLFLIIAAPLWLSLRCPPAPNNRLHRLCPCKRTNMSSASQHPIHCHRASTVTEYSYPSRTPLDPIATALRQRLRYRYPSILTRAASKHSFGSFLKEQTISVRLTSAT